MVIGFQVGKRDSKSPDSLDFGPVLRQDGISALKDYLLWRNLWGGDRGFLPEKLHFMSIYCFPQKGMFLSILKSFSKTGSILAL